MECPNFNLKNIRFQPEHDEYYKNTTKAKLRQMRHLRSKLKTRKLNKMLIRKRQGVPREVINSSQDQLKYYVKPLGNKSGSRIYKSQVAYSQSIESNPRNGKSENLKKSEKKLKKVLKNRFCLGREKPRKSEFKSLRYTRKNMSHLMGDLMGEMGKKSDIEKGMVRMKKSLENVISWFERDMFEPRGKRIKLGRYIIRNNNKQKERKNSSNFNIRDSSIYSTSNRRKSAHYKTRITPKESRIVSRGSINSRNNRKKTKILLGGESPALILRTGTPSNRADCHRNLKGILKNVWKESKEKRYISNRLDIEGSRSYHRYVSERSPSSKKRKHKNRVNFTLEASNLELESNQNSQPLGLSIFQTE